MAIPHRHPVVAFPWLFLPLPPLHRVRTSPNVHIQKKSQGAFLAQGLFASQWHVGATDVRILTATDFGSMHLEQFPCSAAINWHPDVEAASEAQTC